MIRDGNVECLALEAASTADWFWYLPSIGCTDIIAGNVATLLRPAAPLPLILPPVLADDALLLPLILLPAAGALRPFQPTVDVRALPSAFADGPLLASQSCVPLCDQVAAATIP